MNFKTLLIVVISLQLLTYSCKNQGHSNEETAVQSTYKLTSVSSDTSINNPQVNMLKWNPIKHDSNKNEYSLPEEEAVVHINQAFHHGKTLEILSDGKLTWTPFITESHPDSLQAFYEYAFNAEVKGRLTILRKSNNFIKLLKNDSIEGAENLAEYHHSQPPPYMLSSVSISDNDIQLQHGIKIGMSKVEFFNLLGYKESLSSFDTVQNFDTPGELIEQTFIFNNRKLHQITMQLPY